MELFSNLLSPMTSEKLENKGQIFYKVGKLGMLWGLVGFTLFVLSIIGTLIVGGPGYLLGLLAFRISSSFAFMYPIMILAYLGIVFGLIGVGLYF